MGLDNKYKTYKQIYQDEGYEKVTVLSGGVFKSLLDHKKFE